MARRSLILLALVLACAAVARAPRSASADEGWAINNFDVTYDIARDGAIEVTEDIRVDFGPLEKHGIFRDMPVRYDIIDDDKNDRLISVSSVEVQNGSGGSWPFELINSGPNLRIKIGSASSTVSGPQRYIITYTLTGALNADPPDPDNLPYDEFYWNVTGSEWDVVIASASATVRTPSGAIQAVECFDGERGSTSPCESSEFTGDEATFSTRGIGFGRELTIVVGLEKGAVAVAPPILVPAAKSDLQKFQDFFKITPFSVIPTVLIGVLGLVAVLRLWWVEGRDRWLGDVFYLYEDNPAAVDRPKPLMAHESIVVEFTPPELDKSTKRRMRPAEIGLLIDENADTLDVSATIVDLAVRKHLTITEERNGGFLGLFKKTDYALERLEPADDLLPYEARLKSALFSGVSNTVKMSELKNKFHDDLAKVKEALYKQTVKDKLFAYNPDTVRTIARVGSIAVIGLGAGAIYGLGTLFGGGIIGIPLIFVGIVAFFLAPAMPRRTARGRNIYRRALGFRRFMTQSETERQRFAENANIFHEYLPYAIVYGCVERWAKVFADLGIDPGEPGYYVGTHPFMAASFASSMSSFSNSVSSTMASTPGSSGSSGFGGGGSSGGGGGGGGGGSW